MNRYRSVKKVVHGRPWLGVADHSLSALPDVDVTLSPVSATRFSKALHDAFHALDLIADTEFNGKLFPPVRNRKTPDGNIGNHLPVHGGLVNHNGPGRSPSELLLEAKEIGFAG